MSIAKVQAAIAASKDTYVKVPASVLRDACKEAGDDALPLGTHAQLVCDGKLGNAGPDTVMQIHRDQHGRLFALKTVETPPLVT